MQNPEKSLEIKMYEGNCICLQPVLAKDGSRQREEPGDHTKAGAAQPGQTRWSQGCRPRMSALMGFSQTWGQPKRPEEREESSK